MERYLKQLHRIWGTGHAGANWAAEAAARLLDCQRARVAGQTLSTRAVALVAPAMLNPLLTFASTHPQAVVDKSAVVASAVLAGAIHLVRACCRRAVAALVGMRVVLVTSSTAACIAL